MPTLDTRPESVDVMAYAGDTLTISIVAPHELVDGMTWKAEVRSNVDSPAASATFDIIEPTVDGGPAYIVLDAETTTDLAAGGALLRLRKNGVTSMVMRYSGVWDCEISNAGTDPVRTLVQGTLTIDQDVTHV